MEVDFNETKQRLASIADSLHEHIEASAQDDTPTSAVTVTSDDTAHMVLLEEEALGAEDCSADEESTPINEEELRKYSTFLIDFGTIVAARQTLLPRAYDLILACVLNLVHVIRRSDGAGMFISRDVVVQDIVAVFFANITPDLCKLLEKCTWTFQQLYDACMPWSSMKGTGLSGTYA